MKTVIGVRFKPAGKLYYFDPHPFEVSLGNYVIVETARGIEYGEVAAAPHEIADELITGTLKPIIRIATDDDRLAKQRNCELEKQAFGICEQKIAEHKLDMKLVDVEFTFNGAKVTFFFTADGRVDFRDLVKDLAGIFKTRIELRQIGVRDEAKMLGGIGSCGRVICCNSFLGDFHPVSIKMAKEQNLSLSPTKISGLCGRLMCCLKYEQDAYESARKLMPKVGREVITPEGKGWVAENNVITEKVKVKIISADGTIELKEFKLCDIKKVNKPVKEELADLAELAQIVHSPELPELILNTPLPSMTDEPIDISELEKLEGE